jgi:hypothetical protein
VNTGAGVTTREWWTADLPIFTPTETWTLFALLVEDMIP